MRVRFAVLLAVVALVGTGLAASPVSAADQPTVGVDFAQRGQELVEELGLDTTWRHALESAIDPDDYVCQTDTGFRLWVDDLIAGINPAALAVIGAFAVDLWPTLHKLGFDEDAGDEFIGVNGRETREQVSRHKDNQRFWDVFSDDILLLGMHGADIADDAKMVPMLVTFFGVSPGDAQAVVDFVQFVITTEPTLGYDNPLFSLNAFAFSADGGELFPGSGLFPADKIVMGDGVITALRDIGLGRNGPDFVHAHEFAHHVQFEIGAFDSPLPPPEATRRTELMADAFAAYYSAHARGATFQTKRIVDVVESAFTVGDCAFDNPSHHGTPNQRGAAATWGAGIATSARPQGKIEPALDMLARFEAHFPVLIAPDA